MSLPTRENKTPVDAHATGVFLCPGFHSWMNVFFNNADYLYCVWRAGQNAESTKWAVRSNRPALLHAFAGIAHAEERLPSKQWDEVRLL